MLYLLGTYRYRYIKLYIYKKRVKIGFFFNIHHILLYLTIKINQIKCGVTLLIITLLLELLENHTDKINL